MLALFALKPLEIRAIAPINKVKDVRIHIRFILCTIKLAIVLYGRAHPHQISSFICCHEDTSADHRTRFSI